MLSARFAQIREAYDILGDEGQRAIYDSAGLQPLEFYQLFFGGEAGDGKSRGSEKSWICIYLELFTMIVVRGGSFHVQ